MHSYLHHSNDNRNHRLRNPLRNSYHRANNGAHRKGRNLPPFHDTKFLQDPLPNPRGKERNSHPTLRNRPRSQPNGPRHVILSRPTHDLTRRVRPQHKVRYRSSHRPTLHLILLKVSKLLTKATPRRPLPRHRKPIKHQKLPNHRFLEPITRQVQRTL